MSYKLSTKSLERLKGIDQLLIDIITEGIKDSPIDFGIPNDGGLRTAQRQAEMYAQGRTTVGKKITNADGVKKQSYHQSGKAFDIFAYVDGKASWEHKHYEPIARHLQKVALDKFGAKLEWGGDFKSIIDLPHFQI